MNKEKKIINWLNIIYINYEFLYYIQISTNLKIIFGKAATIKFTTNKYF